MRKSPERIGTQPGFAAHALGGELGDKLRERAEASRVRGDIFFVDPAAHDEDVGQPVEQDEVALRPNRVVLCGCHRRLRLAWIHHDDLRIVRIAQHPLPHDRMRDAGIRANEDQDVALFEIRVSERRRVKTE